jgi:hypothetical protein
VILSNATLRCSHGVHSAPHLTYFVQCRPLLTVEKGRLHECIEDRWRVAPRGNPRRAYDKEDADERSRIAARPAERGEEDATRNPDNATLPGLA